MWKKGRKRKHTTVEQMTRLGLKYSERCWLVNVTLMSVKWFTYCRLVYMFMFTYSLYYFVVWYQMKAIVYVRDRAHERDFSLYLKKKQKVNQEKRLQHPYN